MQRVLRGRSVGSVVYLVHLSVKEQVQALYCMGGVGSIGAARTVALCRQARERDARLRTFECLDRTSRRSRWSQNLFDTRIPNPARQHYPCQRPLSCPCAASPRGLTVAYKSTPFAVSHKSLTMVASNTLHQAATTTIELNLKPQTLNPKPEP